MVSGVKQLWRSISGPKKASKLSFDEFRERFNENLEVCNWQPHHLYSVFTQYDQEFYLNQKEMFLHKYRCFYAVSKTISPASIIEMGTSAGSSADAYLSATPSARYVGLDVFAEGTRRDDHSVWDPYLIARQLFKSRGFKKYELMRVNLRDIDKLPRSADLVVVDASHDFDNEYADLRLALTAKPTFIFIDDVADEDNAKPAVEKFLNEDLQGRVEYTLPVDYQGGGLIVKLKKKSPQSK